MASELADRGETALRAVDQLLRDRPVKDGPDFSAAIMALSTLRDTLIARHRAGAPALEPLGRLNGVLTVVIAGHYPLGKVPWPHIETARDTLAGLVTELAAMG
ncbi:MAG: hypothetical protein BGO51_25795 [Rhodospirillales bacterium 69-11]|nr:hypothetical protein [Rhodospirillales bacterium]OJW28281.1 MAG: hypothetical protein BGO51_25795 [Rhodospirillales bacterium 69-11]